VRTLPDVLTGALRLELPILVVNDGSTDGTGEVLKRFPTCEVVDLTPNRGKGFALVTGFEVVRERGYRRAVTLDSDLQHDPADIPLFLESEKDDPRALLVGARDMKAAGAPRANRFGFFMSNLYFRVLSGSTLPDTQSGFRSYPVREVLALDCPPSRFEYEFVVLVAAARAGIPLVPVPISVRYEPATYVSHFRPVTDFMRIFRAGLKAFRHHPPGGVGVPDMGR
jgi:glycosyltransferase involved in cell wall biosynthesis